MKSILAFSSDLSNLKRGPALTSVSTERLSNSCGKIDLVFHCSCILELFKNLMFCFSESDISTSHTHL